MAIASYDAERCQRRNLIAARRDGVDALPVRFLREPPAPPAATEHILSVEGSLPESHEAEMAAINALLPGNEQPLTAYQVYVHYFEAANDNFIGDRFAFFDSSTLKNVAADAATGVAFMNSHRDGGLSHPSELPFGRTFAGRYEEYLSVEGERRQRTLVGFYMLRGIRPNGSGGPSTDDFDQMIRGGTVFDVSVGLRGGERICDVCGNEVGAYDRHSQEYLCSHLPGSDRKMDEQQRESQTARGVPKGKASYSLVGARMAEVSAVYDGAVPGAGFQKAIRLARQHPLTEHEVREVSDAYSRLLGKQDFSTLLCRDMAEDWTRPARPSGKERRRMNLIDRFKAFLGQIEAEEGAQFSEPPGAPETPREPPPVEPKPPEPSAAQSAASSPPARLDPLASARIQELEARLAAQEKHSAEENARRIEAEAEHFASSLIVDSRAVPSEKVSILALYRQAAHDDAEKPATVHFAFDTQGQKQEGTRVDALRALFAVRPKHVLYQEMLRGNLPEGAQVLLNREETVGQGTATPMSEERRKELLGYTSLGQTVARQQQNGGK